LGAFARYVAYDGWATTASIATLIAALVCLFFIGRSFLDQDGFYKAIGRPEDAESAGGYFMAGVPFYFIMYFHFRNRMNEAMRISR
jgi:hypothetical protein